MTAAKAGGGRHSPRPASRPSCSSGRFTRNGMSARRTGSTGKGSPHAVTGRRIDVVERAQEPRQPAAVAFSHLVVGADLGQLTAGQDPEARPGPAEAVVRLAPQL